MSYTASTQFQGKRASCKYAFLDFISIKKQQLVIFKGIIFHVFNYGWLQISKSVIIRKVQNIKQINAKVFFNI